MLQSILEEILINKVDSDFNELIKFLSLFKKDEFIYPSTLKRKFNFDDEKIYVILTELEKAGLVNMYYEVVCHICYQTIGMYKFFSEIPEDIFCGNCDINLILNENVRIVYKVAK